jgi:two-component system cell cycle sensor histidine kinase/response regulator CckA
MARKAPTDRPSWPSSTSPADNRKSPETERYRLLFERCPTGILYTTLEGRILACNPGLARMLGYSTPEEVLGLTAEDLYMDRGDRAPLLKRLLQDRQLKDVEKCFKKKDGTPIWFLANMTLVEDEHGAPGVIEGTLVDITQRKKLEMALRESHAELREANEFHKQVIASTREGVVIHDRELRYVLWNRAMEERTGLCAEDVLGRYPWDFFPFVRDLGIDEAMRGSLRGETHVSPDIPFHVPSTGKHGWFIAQCAPLRDARGEITGVVTTMSDITERKRVEEALRASEQHFRAVFEVSQDGILIADEKGIYVDANPAACRLFARRREELVGHAISEFAPPGLDLEKKWQTLMAEGTARGEYRSEWPDGSIRDTEYWVAAHFLPNRHLAFFRDITESKQLEEQLRHAQKMEAVGQLAGGVAHDFNNLLMVILGRCEMLQGLAAAGDSLQAGVKEIQMAADRAVSLTRQLLAFSRKQELLPRVLDLNQLVRGIETLLRRALGEQIEVILQLESGLCPIKVDQGQFEQVILNLAVNARDAMPAGGRLTIETRNVDLDDAALRTNLEISPGRFTLLAVSDTGTGVDPQIRQHLFEPFFTTKEQGKGTGLGLATAYGIVRQSGGFFVVESAVGEGSSFRIYLPSVPLDDHSLPPCAPQHSLLRGNETILLVSDEDRLRSLLCEMLEQCGYTVLGARTSEEALRVAAEKPFDLLLTDLVMPGINGAELAMRVAREHPASRTMFISGYPSETALKHRAIPSRACFLQKPFTLETLARTVRRVLDAPR